jgi:hypothetical protein
LTGSPNRRNRRYDFYKLEVEENKNKNERIRKELTAITVQNGGFHFPDVQSNVACVQHNPMPICVS